MHSTGNMECFTLYQIFKLKDMSNVYYHTIMWNIVWVFYLLIMLLIVEVYFPTETLQYWEHWSRWLAVKSLNFYVAGILLLNL